MKPIHVKNRRRLRRKLSLRSRLRRETDRPRLSVSRSLKHISAQIIDDLQGRTLVAVSSSARSFAPQFTGKTKSERAAIIGREIAARALAAGVSSVVFDRGASRFHGRVKALADAAREAGLKF
jgi:large subunit ribosomal protein L18